MQSTLKKSFIKLVRSALTGEKFDFPEGFDTKSLYNSAVMHRAVNIILQGAVNCGLDVKSEEVQEFLVGASREIVRFESQKEETKALISDFCRNGIDYVLLKGVVIKDLYPQPFMRVMGDVDVLIREAQYDKVTQVLNARGFKHQCKTDNVYVWHKHKCLHLEVHSSLMPITEKDLYGYFSTYWEKAIKTEGSCYAFSPEDEFIFVFSHFAKHYRDSGIGVRQLCDLWLLRKNNAYDETYLENEFKKLGLYRFYKNILDVLDYWFEGAEGNAITELICDTIICGGAFGTYEDYMKSDVIRKKSDGEKNIQFKNILKRIFPSVSDIEARYSFLEKCPVLLPIAWVLRWHNAIWYERKRITRNIYEIKTVDEKNIQKRKQALHDVGLFL